MSTHTLHARFVPVASMPGHPPLFRRTVAVVGSGKEPAAVYCSIAAGFIQAINIILCIREPFGVFIGFVQAVSFPASPSRNRPD